MTEIESVEPRTLVKDQAELYRKPFDIIKVTVLDSHFWKPGQHLVRISENDFISNNIDRRKRHQKFAPEYWIYVDFRYDKKIPNEEIELIVTKNKGFPCYRLKLSEDDLPTIDNHPYGVHVPTAHQPHVSGYSHFDEPFYQLAKIILSSEGGESVAKSIINAAKQVQLGFAIACPPHKFVPNTKLSVVFCEKCGKSKPV